MVNGPTISKKEYEVLAAFRYRMRQFLRFSEEAARVHGMTPQQHQLLLSIKGFPGREYATITELTERLQLKHHSVVGIIDRSVLAGLVERRQSSEDKRVIEIRLTHHGETRLAAMRHEMGALLEMMGDLADESVQTPATAPEIPFRAGRREPRG